MAKKSCTYRLDEDAALWISSMAERYGCSQGALLESAVAVLDESQLLGRLEERYREGYERRRGQEPESVPASGLVRESARWGVELVGQQAC